jgi:hypothetical protein
MKDYVVISRIVLVAMFKPIRGMNMDFDVTSPGRFPYSKTSIEKVGSAVSIPFSRMEDYQGFTLYCYQFGIQQPKFP